MRRSPRLSIGTEEAKPNNAHLLGTPGTSRQLTDKKRQRSEEEIEAQKRECRNNTVEVRGSSVFYDSHEVLPDQHLLANTDTLSGKNKSNNRCVPKWQRRRTRQLLPKTDQHRL